MTLDVNLCCPEEFYPAFTPGTEVYVPVAKLLAATDEFKFAAWTAYVNWESGHV
jgi:hypothetical protein